jgi:hypothetical protein
MYTCIPFYVQCVFCPFVLCFSIVSSEEKKLIYNIILYCVHTVAVVHILHAYKIITRVQVNMDVEETLRRQRFAKGHMYIIHS